jgi:adenosylmethionine-8-amino-7-oxononanoate aminotransferase
MMCVESVADKTTKALLPEAANEAKRISDCAEAMGLMVRPLGHLNVMSPALTITEDQVDFVVETLGKAIRQVTDDLVRDGYRVG